MAFAVLVSLKLTLTSFFLMKFHPPFRIHGVKDSAPRWAAAVTRSSGGRSAGLI